MPRERKPNKKVVGIRYLSSWHRCECQCGETFFVHIGDVFLVKSDDITNIAVRCPTCKWEAFLWHNNENADFLPNGFVSAIPGERLSGRQDLLSLEHMVEFYRKQHMVSDRYLISLQNACRQLLHKWHRLGPVFFEKELKSLKALLKETEDILEWHGPEQQTR